MVLKESKNCFNRFTSMCHRSLSCQPITLAYKGKHMIAAQAEYRWRFYKRWGAVAFAGAGSIWGNDEEEEAFDRKFLPSAGVGMRFMVSREKRINLRLDYAFGVDGNQGLYFGVRESF